MDLKDTKLEHDGKRTEDSGKSENGTVIINQFKSDGFLDFYYSSDLNEVMKVLNKIFNDI